MPRMIKNRFAFKATASISPAFAIMILSGCATTAATPVNYSIRPVAERNVESVLDAAEAALVENGFAIALRNAKERTITTVPVVETADPGDTSLRSRLRRQTRKLADIRVEQVSDETRVFCKVAVQQQTTETHRLMASDKSSSDLPHDTPIDRGAYSTPEQNTVWETIRRDGAAERAILASITKRVGEKSPS